MEEWLVVRRSPVSPAGETLREWARGTVPMGVSPTPTSASPAAHVPAPEIRVEASTEAGLDDPQGIAMSTPSMPLSLLEPVLRVQRESSGSLLAQAKAMGKTWGLEALGVDPDRHDGKGAKVAVIDTGIVRTHPAFRHLPVDSIVEADFTATPGGAFGRAHDTDGHGTHCAGTICGDTVDGVRIGVAPRISALFVAKAIGGQRGATALIEALDWAVRMRADVISMSLGFDFVGYQDFLVTHKRYEPQAATSMALTAFRDNIRVFDFWMELLARRRVEGFDPIVIAASGNQSSRPSYVVEKSSPSAAEDVVSVGAMDKALGIARFSNTNPTFVAPGVDVISADTGTGLTVMSGTSMACPHLAGLAALYWQAARSGGAPATSRRVLKMMESSAERHRPAALAFADIGEGMPRAPGI